MKTDLEYIKLEPARERLEFEDDEISLLDLLLVIARRKRLIFFVTLLFALTGIAASLLMTKIYTASSRIINPVQKSSILSLMEQQGGVVGDFLSKGADKGNIYLSMLKSRNMEERILNRFAPANWGELAGAGREKKRKELVEEYIGELSATAEKDSTILVSVAFTDQDKVADIANAYVEELHLLANYFILDEATMRRTYFETELAGTRKTLSQAEEKFREYQEKTGVYLGDAQLTANIQNRINMRAQIAAKEIQLRSLLGYATRQNPEVVKLERDISGLKEEINRLEMDPGTGDPLNPMGGMPAARFDYQEKFRDWKFQEVLYNTLLKLYESARLDESYTPVVIQVLDRAVTPEQRTKPNRKLIVLLAVFLGFFVSIFCAFVAEGLRKAAEDPEQAEKLREFRRLFWLDRSSGGTKQARTE